jgi:hypothetical protein
MLNSGFYVLSIVEARLSSFVIVRRAPLGKIRSFGVFGFSEDREVGDWSSDGLQGEPSVVSGEVGDWSSDKLQGEPSVVSGEVGDWSSDELQGEPSVVSMTRR